MKISQWNTVSVVALATLLTACGVQQNTTKQNTVQQQNISDPYLIPSYGGSKVQTTNQYGHTTQGMGSGTFSTIGSSGLHSAGISSNLESRLNGAGIGGVKVLVLDDNIVLVREKQELATTHYDPLQQKVLSPHGGQSGKGPEPNTSMGTEGTGRNISFDNLDRARDFMAQMFGSNVKILTVNDPQAVDIVNRIKSNLKSPGNTSVQVSKDVQNLLKMAK